MRKRQGQRGFGGKACNRRIQRGDGASRGDRGGATRFGELTTITRPRDTLPHARSGPTSLTLAGRPGSLRGQRGKKSARPARGSSKSDLQATTPRKKLLKPKEGGHSQFSTLEVGPDVLLRQQRPYGSTSTGRGTPTSVCSAPVPPTRAESGTPAPGWRISQSRKGIPE